LEPWQWQTVLVTATEWGNFLALRTDGAAQREIHLPALLIQEALNGSTPHPLNYNQWHLPLIQPDELDLARQEPDKWVRISVGRCARVSYLTHDGRRDLGKDLELHDRLAASGHMSPLEHAARPMTVDEARNPVLKSNFRGWVQYRKLRPFENDRSLFLADQPD
jgi:thymidylate synthase ThyX